MLVYYLVHFGMVFQIFQAWNITPLTTFILNFYCLQVVIRVNNCNFFAILKSEHQFNQLDKHGVTLNTLRKAIRKIILIIMTDTQGMNLNHQVKLKAMCFQCNYPYVSNGTALFLHNLIKTVKKRSRLNIHIIFHELTLTFLNPTTLVQWYNVDEEK